MLNNGCDEYSSYLLTELTAPFLEIKLCNLNEEQARYLFKGYELLLSKYSHANWFSAHLSELVMEVIREEYSETKYVDIEQFKKVTAKDAKDLGGFDKYHDKIDRLHQRVRKQLGGNVEREIERVKSSFESLK
jgi:hypothetical protein